MYHSAEILQGRPIQWAFIPNTTQERALKCPFQHILLTGGRGWGKTELQLMRFRSRVGFGYGAFWKGIIFDRQYKNLADLISKSKRLFALDPTGPRYNASELKWIWPSGEELTFAHVKTKDDYWNYHGHEYAFIGWNELTKFPDDYLYNKMMSVNRTGFNPAEHTPRLMGHNGGPPMEAEDGTPLYATPNGRPLPPIPLEVCSTTNPHGAGHNWVKRRFIDPSPFGDPVFTDYAIERIDVTTGVAYTEKVTRSQIALHGTYKENPYLDAAYIAGLYAETDPNVIEAWVRGNWDIVAGGALDDLWKKSVHVLPRFRVPKTWRIDRCFDWGSSDPFSVGWFAEANGEEATLADGTTFCPPPGTLIQIAEWYGAKGGYGTNTGLIMSASDIAKGIAEREAALTRLGWISGPVWAGPADNQIRDVRERDVETIEAKMKKHGITWTASDKWPGSRVNGLQLTRDRLQASGRWAKGESNEPGMFFLENCRASIACLPSLPRDDDNPDDVDTTVEDHPYDMVRYRVLAGARRMATTIQSGFAR